jgi:hypothetical protein
VRTPEARLRGTARILLSIRLYRFVQFAIAWSFAAGIFSCRSSDQDMQRDATCNRLKQLARVVETMINRRAEFNEREILSTPKNLLYAAYASDLIPEVEVQDRLFEFDGWGRPFVWSARTGEDGFISVTILSTGRNAVNEEERGDDCWVQLRINAPARTVTVGDVKCR